MNIKKMSLEDLELMSYTDIAYELIKESKNKKTTIEIFREICTLLQMDENQVNNLVADFFASMTTDKRFILLEEGTWDLRDNHSSSKIKKGAEFEDNEEDDEYDEEEINEDEEQDENEEDEYDSLDEINEDDDFEDDSLDDLVIVDEKDLGMDD